MAAVCRDGECGLKVSALWSECHVSVHASKCCVEVRAYTCSVE